MSEQGWIAYRESIKDYRDKDVAHIEVRPVSHVPDMRIALQAVDYYYTYVIQELSQYSNYSGWPRELKDYYQKSLAQTKPIVASAYAATSNVILKRRSGKKLRRDSSPLTLLKMTSF
jgi:hypothetical protein